MSLASWSLRPPCPKHPTKAVHHPKIETMVLIERLVAMKAASATSTVKAMMVVRVGLVMQASASPAMMVMLATLMVLQAKRDTMMVLLERPEIQKERPARLEVLWEGRDIRIGTAAAGGLVPCMVVAATSAKIA